MNKQASRFTILVAEDDPDDRVLLKDAFEESRLPNNVYFVDDGNDLLDYLYQRGKYHNPEDAPRPSLILLDLNMPRKDGREALMEIKSDLDLRQIPVVVLTTSTDEEDILRSYASGASSYIAKAELFEALVENFKILNKYWFEMVELPV